MEGNNQQEEDVTASPATGCINGTCDLELAINVTFNIFKWYVSEVFQDLEC